MVSGSGLMPAAFALTLAGLVRSLGLNFMLWG